MSAEAPRGTRRELRWPDCRNARDLGDIPLTDGGRTRRAVLVRSDSLSRLTDEGVAAVRAYGVDAVVDLRETAILGRYPYPPQLLSSVRYHHVPLLPERFPLPVPVHALREALNESAPRWAELVAAIAGARGTCVFHCHSGTGRTGLVAMVLLALVDADPQGIIADHVYAASAEPNAPHAVETRDRATAAARLVSWLTEAQGAARFLLTAGANPGDVEAVRRRLTAHPTPP